VDLKALGLPSFKHFWIAGTGCRDITKDQPGRTEYITEPGGDISHPATAQKVVDTAVQKFGSVDALVNNAGIFMAKPFTDYTIDDFRALVSTNLEGYFHITQLAVKQMLVQKSG
jgi:NAD(P)-dependent dehydrogenase (short-subunit alcohol dehydrogenase family)